MAEKKLTAIIIDDMELARASLKADLAAFKGLKHSFKIVVDN